MKAQVRAPGTCGELAQGVIGDRYLHITFPINAWVTAEASVVPGDGQIYGLDDRPKSKRAAQTLLTWRGIQHLDVQVNLINPLPVGKGMASSTADITATLQAAALCLGLSLSPWDIARIALSIEPSDGLFFPGVTVFDHREGRFAKKLIKEPSLDLNVLIVDIGGHVDTQSFNQRSDLTDLNRKKESHTKEAFRKIIMGLRLGDARLVAEGATISSLANQQILPKPGLDQLLHQAIAVGALGVNIAHSGTIIGILASPAQPVNTRRLQSWLEKNQPDWKLLGWQRLADGGAQVCGFLDNTTDTQAIDSAREVVNIATAGA